MLAVGLTGGIGSGKSAVAGLLVERGAVLIDADQVAREVVEPGGPAYQPLIDRFGPEIVAADVTIDRQALAKVAFADEATRQELNAITHPAIGIAMIQARDALENTDDIVVLAIPLLTAAHRETVKLHKVVVVDTPVDVALARLLSQRGFDRQDAEARIRSQISREERVKEADYVLDNSGDRAALEREVAELWDWLVARRFEGGHDLELGHGPSRLPGRCDGSAGRRRPLRCRPRCRPERPHACARRSSRAATSHSHSSATSRSRAARSPELSMT